MVTDMGQKMEDSKHAASRITIRIQTTAPGYRVRAVFQGMCNLQAMWNSACSVAQSWDDSLVRKHLAWLGSPTGPLGRICKARWL